jgi:hypothetical protein
MSENKCCGNCRFFGSEDLGGYGECQLSSTIRYCGDSCISYRPLFDSWTEITPDNEHELTDELIGRAVIGWRDSCNRQHIVAFADCAMGVVTMAKYGGYYYYVLPELKIE